MGQALSFIGQDTQPEDNDIIFAYDLKSMSKHFIAGTSVINCVDELSRFDDYGTIKQKKGLQIKSIGIYRSPNKIVGYEISYKDDTNKTISIKRIASGFRSFSSKACITLKLQYNEHLTNIDLIYNQDEIKYIEITTSKGKSLKVGTQIENGYTSLNKVDTAQKNYAPIIAFESTFSKDCLKELFIYRCPVRITRRKKKQELTVMEVNHLKAAPNLQRLSKAQENLNLLRNFTRQGISSLRVVRTWQAFVQRSKQQGSINASSTLDTSSIKLESLVSPKKSQEALMEEQEYGVDEDADKEEAKKEEEKEKEKEKRFSEKRKSRSSFRIFNPFGTRKGSNSPHNQGSSKEESFDAQIKKIAKASLGKKSSSNGNSGNSSSSKDGSPKSKKNNEENKNLRVKKGDEIVQISSKDDLQKQEVLQERISQTEIDDTSNSKWKTFSLTIRRKLKAFFIFNDLKKKTHESENDNNANNNNESEPTFKTEESPIKTPLSQQDNIDDSEKVQ